MKVIIRANRAGFRRSFPLAVGLAVNCGDALLVDIEEGWRLVGVGFTVGLVFWRATLYVGRRVAQ